MSRTIRELGDTRNLFDYSSLIKPLPLIQQHQQTQQQPIQPQQSYYGGINNNQSNISKPLSLTPAHFQQVQQINNNNNNNMVDINEDDDDRDLIINSINNMSKQNIIENLNHTSKRLKIASS